MHGRPLKVKTSVAPQPETKDDHRKESFSEPYMQRWPKLREWAKIDPAFDVLGNDWPSLFTSLKTMTGKLFTEHIKNGGMEMIATSIRVLEQDTDYNNELTAEELAAVNDDAVDSLANLIINVGVVSALLLSFVFPLLLESLEMSDKAIEYTTEENLAHIERTYYVCLALANAMSFNGVLMCTWMYMGLTCWMPNKRCKVWWMHHITTVPLTTSLTFTLVFMLLSVPLRIFLVSSPEAGLIVASCLYTGILCFGGTFAIKHSVICMARVHAEWKTFVSRESQHQKELAESPPPGADADAIMVSPGTDEKLVKVLELAGLAGVKEQLESASLSSELLIKAKDDTLLLEAVLRQAGLKAGECLALICALKENC